MKKNKPEKPTVTIELTQGAAVYLEELRKLVKPADLELILMVILENGLRDELHFRRKNEA
jgi:hypothetical protein